MIVNSQLVTAFLSRLVSVRRAYWGSHVAAYVYETTQNKLVRIVRSDAPYQHKQRLIENVFCVGVRLLSEAQELQAVDIGLNIPNKYDDFAEHEDHHEQFLREVFNGLQRYVSNRIACDWLTGEMATKATQCAALNELSYSELITYLLAPPPPPPPPPPPVDNDAEAIPL